MDRSDLVRRLILNEICDDFEGLDRIIFPNVTKNGDRFGVKIQRAEVVAEMGKLVNEGLAKAYDLSVGIQNPFSGELGKMPDITEENFRIHFYITPKGMEFHQSNDEWWPPTMAL
jgi:hypothetical protein